MSTDGETSNDYEADLSIAHGADKFGLNCVQAERLHRRYVSKGVTAARMLGYLHLLGVDRLCDFTGTGFGPGFLPSRTVRVTLLHFAIFGYLS
ncbi:MAG: hypothetical protein ACREJ0_13735 [Geminicoccaceae bacterium]